MRNHGIQEWDRNHPYAVRMKILIKDYPATYETFQKGIENQHAEICLNVIVGLIRVTQYLLSRQIKSLEQDFVKHGGLRERMTRVRLEERNKQR